MVLQETQKSQKGYRSPKGKTVYVHIGIWRDGENIHITDTLPIITGIRKVPGEVTPEWTPFEEFHYELDAISILHYGDEIIPQPNSKPKWKVEKADEPEKKYRLIRIGEE